MRRHEHIVTATGRQFAHECAQPAADAVADHGATDAPAHGEPVPDAAQPVAPHPHVEQPVASGAATAREGVEVRTTAKRLSRGVGTDRRVGGRGHGTDRSRG